MLKYIASCVIGVFMLAVLFLAAPVAEAQTPCRQNNDYYTNPAVYEACMRRHNATRGDFGRGERSQGRVRATGRGEFHCRSSDPRFCQQQARRLVTGRREPPFIVNPRMRCAIGWSRQLHPAERARFRRNAEMAREGCLRQQHMNYRRGEGGMSRRRGGGYADANDARECRLARQIGGMIGEALQGDRCERRRRR